MSASCGIDRWIAEAARIRQQDGGYTFESLAVAMVLELGWNAAAKTANALEHHVRGWYISEGAQAAVTPLYDLLGWEQAALLHAWFANLDNYREVRDTIGIAGVGR